MSVHLRRALLVSLALATAVLMSVAAPASASHEVPWDATVNGQPFHGDGSPHLAGCTIDVDVTGLTDDAHAVAASVSLTDPSGDAVVATDATTVDGTSWSVSFPLDAALVAVPPHANGHHVVVELTVDGLAETSQPFWLACGATGGGNPFRVVLDVVWQLEDGMILSGPPTALDRSGYRLDAASSKGQAACTYGPAGDELVCTYANHGGHQGELGALIVPGGKGHAFTVDQTALPEGWSATAGIGTFVARDVCPRHGGHGDAAALVQAAATEPPCEHVVVNVGPVPTSSTTTTTTATPTTTTATPATTTAAGPADLGAEAAATTTTVATSPPSAAGAVMTATAAGTLPRTGSSSTLLTGAGAVLVVAGLVLVRRARSLPA